MEHLISIFAFVICMLDFHVENAGLSSYFF